MLVQLAVPHMIELVTSWFIKGLLQSSLLGMDHAFLLVLMIDYSY